MAEQSRPPPRRPTRARRRVGIGLSLCLRHAERPAACAVHRERRAHHHRRRIATGALWNHVRTYSWFNDIAYGVPALQEGKWWTLVTGWFFGLTPGQYVSIIVVFASAVGWCEWRLGTKKAAIVTISGQLAANSVHRSSSGRAATPTGIGLATSPPTATSG